MTPTTLDVDDVLITLKAIERNKAYECRCEEHQIPCQLKQKLPLRSSSNVLVATEVLLNIRNVSTEPFPIDISSWELIDTEGYAYKALAICDALRPAGVIDLDYHGHTSPGTQVDLILLFPELKRSKQIACLSYGTYGRHRELHLFEISKSKRRALDLVQVREQLRSNPRSSRIEDCKEYLELLQLAIQSSLSKELTRAESESLDKRITKLAQTIGQALLRIKQPDRKSLETLFQATTADYQRAVESAQERADERKKASQKLEDLRRLSAGGFEEYISDLFEGMDYQRVNLRGRSGDQGVDILAERNGERVAIQCKKYKGVVGPHEVRALMGAMGLADAQRGLLITTGMFSIQAQKIADEAPIEMIDGNKLIELIAQAGAK